MSTITTYTGIRFDPICPDAALIRIEHIARRLPTNRTPRRVRLSGV